MNSDKVEALLNADPELKAMFDRALAHPDHGKPMPTVDAALLVVGDESLSYQQKHIKLSQLQKQAAKHELNVMADIWSGLITTTPLDERLAYEVTLK